MIVCSGRENRFSLDDALCAGLLLQRLGVDGDGDVVMNDAARVAADLASNYTVSADFLGSTAAGKNLLGIGLESDLELCASLDRHSLVPEMRERRISVPPQEGLDT
ncbi:MAG: 2-phosphosulfolactate phosphatase [Gemmatimonadetes bacterium]|nr:2-phosphosulfolactate phosphatase [Gemmatimonadota bacterium]